MKRKPTKRELCEWLTSMVVELALVEKEFRQAGLDKCARQAGSCKKSVGESLQRALEDKLTWT